MYCGGAIVCSGCDMSWFSLWTPHLRHQQPSAPLPAALDDGGEWRLWKDPQLMEILRLQLW